MVGIGVTDGIELGAAVGTILGLGVEVGYGVGSGKIRPGSAHEFCCS